MCRVTVACAAVPDELEGLAGHVLRASENIPAKDDNGLTKISDSVSFLQPVEDDVVRILDFLCDGRFISLQTMPMLLKTYQLSLI